jgi:LPXTG-motif cell wall-anchored protein
VKNEALDDVPKTGYNSMVFVLAGLTLFGTVALIGLGKKRA